MMTTERMKVLASVLGVCLVIGLIAGFILLTKPTKSREELLAETQADGQRPAVVDKELLATELHINQSREILKTMVADDGTTFIEVHSPVKDQQTLVELWRIDAKETASIFHAFFIRECDAFEWNVDGNELLVTESVSPCEAFVEVTQILYASSGDEQFRSQWNSSSSEFSFKKALSPQMGIRSIVDPTCDAGVLTSSNIPKTTFTGVELMNKRGDQDVTQFVPAPQPTSVDCGIGYGDLSINPTIGQPTYNGTTIQFDLPGGYNGSFDFSAAEGSQLILTKKS